MQCSVPTTSMALKLNNAATSPVLQSLLIKKKKKKSVGIFSIFFLYTVQAWAPVKWRKHGLPSKRQMKAWTLQRWYVLFPHLKAEWKNPLLQHSWPTSAQGTSSDKKPNMKDTPVQVLLSSWLKFWHRYEYAKCIIKI